MTDEKRDAIANILSAARAVSKEKNIKRRERRIKEAEFNLKRSSDEQVLKLWERVQNEGAENVFAPPKK